MGNSLTRAAPAPPPQVMLCPPLFERNILARNRMAECPYDYLFTKYSRSHLFGDYFCELRKLTGQVLLRSPDDPRLDVCIQVGSKEQAAEGTIVSDMPSGQAAAKRLSLAADRAVGDIGFRFQLQPNDPNSFIMANISTKASRNILRMSYFDLDSGVGTFARLPLRLQPPRDTPVPSPRPETVKEGFVDVPAVKGKSSPPTGTPPHARRGIDGSAPGVTMGDVPGGLLKTADADPCIGIRYSSPRFTAGIMTAPYGEALGSGSGWLIGHVGNFTAGAVYRATAPELRRMGKDIKALGSDDGDLLKLARQAADGLCYAVSYSSAPSAVHSSPLSPSFDICLEVQERRQLIASYFQHLVVTRKVANPFEEEGVVGITNYIDIGCQIVQSLDETDSTVPDAQFAASWQVNKNWLLKAKVSSYAVAAAAVFKAWWNPSFTLGIMGRCNFNTWKPSIGAVFKVENFGDVRYESAGAVVKQAAPTMQRRVIVPDKEQPGGERPLMLYDMELKRDGQTVVRKSGVPAADPKDATRKAFSLPTGRNEAVDRGGEFL
eukprot:jgi/Mesvir1/14974/Mv14637-RA.1